MARDINNDTTTQLSDAHARVSKVFAKFISWFGTSDLKEAKILRDDLHAQLRLSTR